MSKFFKLEITTGDGKEEFMPYLPGELGNAWKDFQMFKNFRNVKMLRILIRDGPSMDKYVELDRWVRFENEAFVEGYVDSHDRNAPVPGVGSRWIWEKGKPHAEVEIRVVDVKWNGEEYWVHTISKGDDNIIPNDLSRFWEAVTPFK